ncbi:unnamed protein product [Oikopleura dioica]|uniref:Uncharacterized protein n=1 Tax=Oikopleura dioica TaxID=34765 RepID=E4YA23_OIKDI|nr:unnamed protein product [Oikopleura dioica]
MPVVFVADLGSDLEGIGLAGDSLAPRGSFQSRRGRFGDGDQQSSRSDKRHLEHAKCNHDNRNNNDNNYNDNDDNYDNDGSSARGTNNRNNRRYRAFSLGLCCFFFEFFSNMFRFNLSQSLSH